MGMLSGLIHYFIQIFLYVGHINKGVFTQADIGTFLNWAAGILMTVFTGSDDDDEDDDDANNIDSFLTLTT